MGYKEKAKALINYWKKYEIIKDKKVLEAFQKVNREYFVPAHLKQEAYVDAPLPIGYGQTISQPTTIAIMTQALELRKGLEFKVLEIGTGSGYQAALIAYIIGKGKVITTEIIPELVDFAKANLRKAKIKNVEVLHVDGSLGYKKEAPYDRIIMTAASPSVPKQLITQLKEQGIFVGPVGTYHQQMLKIRRLGKRKTKIDNLGDFVFVPLRGKKGF
ncbi:protein-L-isoaspartate O-methyltransferase [Candidatus Pacearchaeota archaeon ex4484_26]|nr:MAG: protein-L-isoaspartate O-methyltransferase [Candidatus Pacearchaeota archaeon ex4484_26]